MWVCGEGKWAGNILYSSYIVCACIHTYIHLYVYIYIYFSRIKKKLKIKCFKSTKI